MADSIEKIDYLRVFIQRILLWASSPLIVKWFSRKLAVIIAGYLMINFADLEPALKALLDAGLAVAGLLAFAAVDYAERKYKPTPIDITPRPDTVQDFINQPRK